MKSLTYILIALLAVAALPALATGDNHWHVSTYRAEYFDGHDAANQALYCGDETIPACTAQDTIGGIGRDWLDDVEWRSSVADPSQPVTVRLTGLLNYDLPDLNWDFLNLYIQRGTTLELLNSWTGTYASTVSLDFTATLNPGEYTGPGNDEVRLVWRVVASADGWDDEDCLNPSHGACQIDDLYVYFDGVRVTYDTFEPGSPVSWTPVGDAITAADDVPGIGQVAVAAHPNPFNPRTTIAFALPQAADVSLALFDLQGRLVRTLVNATTYPAGRHQQVWDGRDDLGQTAPSGVYFYRFTAGQESRTGKLTMLK